MKKFLINLIVLAICLFPVCSMAEETIQVDSTQRTITITGEGEFKRGDTVKLILIRPDMTFEALEKGEVSAKDAIAYVKETTTTRTKYEFAEFTLSENEPYGAYTARIIINETVTDIEVPYVSASQIEEIFGDSEKADDLVWLLENFGAEMGVAAEDVERIQLFDKDGLEYFVKNYIAGQGLEDLTEEEFKTEFSEKLGEYLVERETTAIVSFNDANSASEIKNCFDAYNDIFGIDFADAEWFGGLSDDSKANVYERLGKVTAIGKADVQKLLNEQIALRKIQLGPWGEEGNILDKYKTLLSLNLTELNALSDKTAVYKKLVDEYILTPDALQQKINSAVTEVKNASLGTGGISGGGGGGGKGAGGKATGAAFVPQVKPDENKTKEYSDIGNFAWAKTAIYELSEMGVVNGKSEEKFCPGDSVTRAEFAKMLALTFKISIKGNGSDFADVAASHWAKPYIDAAFDNGIINGVDGRFMPDNKITREDMAVMIYRSLKAETDTEVTGFADDGEISGYAKKAVAYMAEKGIISGKGDGMFAPGLSATRAEAAVMIYNAINSIK